MGGVVRVRAREAIYTRTLFSGLASHQLLFCNKKHVYYDILWKEMLPGCEIEPPPPLNHTPHLVRSAKLWKEGGEGV